MTSLRHQSNTCGRDREKPPGRRDKKTTTYISQMATQSASAAAGALSDPGQYFRSSLKDKQQERQCVYLLKNK